jgi:nitrogenase iron protein NifH
MIHGCHPKADSTGMILGGKMQKTTMDTLQGRRRRSLYGA